MKRNYLHQLLIAIDQLANALLAGHADETLSARAYRMSPLKKRWSIVKTLINGMFFWQENHCRSAYRAEQLRRHLPEHYYNNEEFI